MGTDHAVFHSVPVSKIGAIHYPVASAAAPETQHSPQHSPVPYLFGGFAAVIGLIAFALLILACAYRKLFSGEERESEGGEKREIGSDAKEPPAFEEKLLVIMAGEVKPTFLATPIFTSNRAAAAAASSSPSAKSNQNQDKENETGNSKIQNQIVDVTIIREDGESSRGFQSTEEERIQI